jgi:uncharacterized protein (TIGR02271 family)
MPAELPTTAQTVVIPLAEESLRVEKREVETGRVRVSVRTDMVEDMVRDTLRSRSAVVEHVPVGREIDQVPAIREEDGVTIIPVVEEVLVVEKRLFLKEEVHIRFNDIKDEIQIPVQRRVQRAVIDRSAADEAAKEE